MGESHSSMKRVRLSYGSAVELGLIRGILEARPTTAYLFLKDKGCRGMCGFCPQSFGSEEERISRVDWPEFALSEVQEGLSGDRGLQRICIQCTDEPLVKEGVPKLVRELKRSNGVPISVSTSPITLEQMERIKEAGADTLTIPLDCANKKLFPLVKGRLWSDHWRALRDALEIFGRGKVGTHIIVGLGETERDAVVLIDRLWRMGVVPSLFAFTPIRGTPFEGRCAPLLSLYRRVQLARHLIVESGATFKDIRFDRDSRIREFCVPASMLEEALENGIAFMTRGCPGCNRPYFNEKVSGPIFNYANRPKKEDLAMIKGDIFGVAEGH
jgi:biotin synthase-related radical SAM superfamily protein